MWAISHHELCRVSSNLSELKYFWTMKKQPSLWSEFWQYCICDVFLILSSEIVRPRICSNRVIHEYKSWVQSNFLLMCTYYQYNRETGFYINASRTVQKRNSKTMYSQQRLVMYREQEVLVWKSVNESFTTCLLLNLQRSLQGNL